jgi:hypothetical protein
VSGLTAVDRWRPFVRARGGHAGLLRSRPGADAVRRFRSLGAQGLRPLAGYRKAVLCPVGTITCLQSQIGQDRHLQRQGTAQVTAGVVLSVGVRSRPVRTAVNGTLVARPVRTTVTGIKVGATALLDVCHCR